MAEGYEPKPLESMVTPVAISGVAFSDNFVANSKTIDAYRIGKIIYVQGWANGITAPLTGGTIFKNLPACNSYRSRFPVVLSNGKATTAFWNTSQSAWQINTLQGETSIHFGFSYIEA